LAIEHVTAWINHEGLKPGILRNRHSSPENFRIDIVGGLAIEIRGFQLGATPNSIERSYELEEFFFASSRRSFSLVFGFLCMQR